MFSHASLLSGKIAFTLRIQSNQDSTSAAPVNQQSGWGLVAMAMYGAEKAAGEARERQEGTKAAEKSWTAVFIFLFTFLLFFFHVVSLGSSRLPSRNRQERPELRTLSLVGERLPLERTPYHSAAVPDLSGGLHGRVPHNFSSFPDVKTNPTILFID